MKNITLGIYVTAKKTDQSVRHMKDDFDKVKVTSDLFKLSKQ